MPTIYDTVTDRIIAAIERGAGSWTRPWAVKARDTSSMPHNVESGNCYRGINTLVLWCTAEERGYPSHLHLSSMARARRTGAQGREINFDLFLESHAVHQAKC